MSFQLFLLVLLAAATPALSLNNCRDDVLEGLKPYCVKDAYKKLVQFGEFNQCGLSQKDCNLFESVSGKASDKSVRIKATYRSNRTDTNRVYNVEDNGENCYWSWDQTDASLNLRQYPFYVSAKCITSYGCIVDNSKVVPGDSTNEYFVSFTRVGATAEEVKTCFEKMQEFAKKYSIPTCNNCLGSSS